ncbi:hypothetical protein GCM10023149_06750 [Mucilaginibacter gynuensis]|uniref:N-acetyltransferase domain-containing protein n=1 Tax=Mucilaginibacter gynuensis TaxID=1302236 RepID=A0ABP8FV81_9SPHI
MIITEVTDKITRNDFLNTARIIYRQYPNWVCPLDNDIEAVFDPEKNSFHQHGNSTRWILKNDTGLLIGRIAAFIDTNKAYKHEQPTGGVGFFECIDNEAAAFLLFDTAKQWLANQGMQAMDGPINFGENDSFWGLLTEGFTPPSYGMNYNPPYYKNLFEKYGFTALYEQITNHFDLRKPLPDRLSRIAERTLKKPGYRFEYLKKAQIQRFAADFMEVYNDAWKDFENFTPISFDTILQTFEKMKMVLDEQLIWFAYINDEPVAFIVVLPDANQLIKPMNGKMDLVGKLKYLYQKWKGATRMRAIVMGTKQKYQNHGIESGMFYLLKKYISTVKQYDELELSWVGDFNKKMLALNKAIGATFGKKHATMRYKF